MNQIVDWMHEILRKKNFLDSSSDIIFSGRDGGLKFQISNNSN